MINNILNKVIKNETVFQHDKTNKNMHSRDRLQLLIDYTFDFAKLVDVYDNIVDYIQQLLSFDQIIDHIVNPKKM